VGTRASAHLLIVATKKRADKHRIL